MNDTYCTCIVKSLRDEHGRDVLSTVFEFLLSLVISMTGVFLNYKFLTKLKIERRNKPLGRKGNVIEPIMRWFLVIQIIFWPYELLMFSRVISFGSSLSTMIPALCPFIFWMIVLGRTIIAYNSLFVALIRYVYIVHERKANQWDFEKVGRRFQIASICTPILHVLTFSFTMRKPGSEGLIPDTNHCSQLESLLINFTSQFIPDPFAKAMAIICAVLLVFVYLNIAEMYLYVRIYQTIKR